VTVFYNEFDKFAAQWLRNLADAGHISKGEINERSIKEITGPDLAGFIQAHFFAGIGGWDLALRIAGWPSDRPVWTGSCPCQPFSAAGKRKGTDDERHLWPEFLRLIAERRPSTIFGEQVASKDGRIWLAGVRSDLEALGYAVGAADLCAAGIGAPHIRQRIYWVAYTPHPDRRPGISGGETGIREDGIGRIGSCGRGGIGGLVDPIQPGLEGHAGHGDDRDQPRRIGADAPRSIAETSGTSDRLGDAESGGRGIVGDAAQPRSGGHIISPSWSRFEFAPCRDGKTRRFEPESFPLAYGLPGRVGRLRGYGNAIAPPLAAEFIAAIMEIAGIKPEGI
jgi:DNA (cytosine-5)-methyltransferase 1